MPLDVAYFIGVDATQVGEYFIDGTTGVLYASNLNGASVGSYANSGALDPQNRFLYVASGSAALANGPGSAANGAVFVFSINSASGSLTTVAGSPFAWDAIPTSITVASNGRFLYTAMEVRAPFLRTASILRPVR